MGQPKSTGLLGLLLGSPLALIGLIMLLSGKMAVGSCFLLLGLAGAIGGGAAARNANPQAGEQDPLSPVGSAEKPAE